MVVKGIKNVLKWQCKNYNTRKDRCCKEKQLYKLNFRDRNYFSPGELVFLCFWGFTNDIPHKILVDLTKVPLGTVNRLRADFNAAMGKYLDEYFRFHPLGLN